MDSLTSSGLPKKQAKALMLAASGKTRKESAKIMGCSPDNVAKLIQAVLCKLNAKNTPEAITIAFQKGILRFLSLFLVIFGISTTLVPPASAIDDDPLARRLRSPRTRKGSRRITRGMPQSAAITQLYIDCFGLEPVLAWDDGQMFVHYQPTTPFQIHPTAHVFNIDDLLRWHSDQFYKSFERTEPHYE